MNFNFFSFFQTTHTPEDYVMWPIFYARNLYGPAYFQTKIHPRIGRVVSSIEAGCCDK